jgi:Skp family chaperone for outer membrane proteins
MNTFGKFLLTCFLAASACGAGAQQGKVGIIDLREVFDKYHKTKTADAHLKDHAADLDKERKIMIEQYQKATDDYKTALDGANDQAVSADEREKRKKTAESKLLDIKKLEGDIGQFDRQARTTLEEEQRKYRDRILAEIRTIITNKAKAGGYTLVIDSAAETVNKTPVVMYNNGENDITTAVLADLNANAPASTTSPGAVPPATSGAKNPALVK